MGIELDWEVESTEGQQKIGEDAAVHAARQRRTRLWKRGLIAAGVMFVLLGAGAWVRYRQVQQLRREMLIATAESELLALRIADKYAFMQRQGPEEVWRAAQRASFEAYQRFGARVELPHEPGDPQIEGNEAQMPLLAVIDGAERPFTWVYEYTDKGWRHVASVDVPWDKRSTRGEFGVTYAYYGIDAELARSIEASVTTWWRIAQDVTGESAPKLVIELQPGEPDVAWAEGDTLIVPSTGPDREPLRALTPALHSHLALLIADHWTWQVLPDPIAYDAPWVAGGVVMELHRMFEPSAPAAPVLGPLVDVFGREFLRDFVARARLDGDPEVALRESIRYGTEITEGQVELARLLEALLKSEVTCWTYVEEFACRAEQIFGREYSLGIGPNYPQPESIKILSTQQSGQIIWAEVQAMYEANNHPPSSFPEERITRYIPYWLVDGLWIRSAPRDSQASSAFTQTGSFITLIYFEEHLPFVEGLHETLESSYQRAARDLGVESPPALTVTIVESGAPSFVESPGDPHHIFVPSPYNGWVPEGSTARYELERYVLRSLIQQVILYRADLPGSQWSESMEAMLQWELIRLGYSFEFIIGAEPVTAPLYLWTHRTSVEDVYGPRLAELMRVLALIALIDAVAEEYGMDAVAVLVEHLAEYNGHPDSWLQAGLGIDSSSLEAAWQTGFEQALRENTMVKAQP